MWCAEGDEEALSAFGQMNLISACRDGGTRCSHAAHVREVFCEPVVALLAGAAVHADLLQEGLELGAVPHDAAAHLELLELA